MSKLCINAEDVLDQPPLQRSPKGEQHQPFEMQRKKPLVLYTSYEGKSYRGLFFCPECGRETWQNLSYLGRRKLVCNGKNIAKVVREAMKVRAKDVLEAVKKAKH